MYRRPKFLEILLEIRREMAREADYDVDLFAEVVSTDAPSASDNDLADPETVVAKRVSIDQVLQHNRELENT